MYLRVSISKRSIHHSLLHMFYLLKAHRNVHTAVWELTFWESGRKEWEHLAQSSVSCSASFRRDTLCWHLFIFMVLQVVTTVNCLRGHTYMWHVASPEHEPKYSNTHFAQFLRPGLCISTGEQLLGGKVPSVNSHTGKSVVFGPQIATGCSWCCPRPLGFPMPFPPCLVVL